MKRKLVTTRGRLKMACGAAAGLAAGTFAASAALYETAVTQKTELRRPFSAPATNFEQKDVMVDGLRLRYIDEGSGPPLVLIPGHGSRIEELDGLTAILRARFRVLVFDFPGSGYSDKPERDYGLTFYENALVGFLDALGVEKCFLAGGSLGGNLALRLGHRIPDRFPRLAAWGPGSAWPAQRSLAALMRVVGGRVLFWPTIRVQSTYWHDADWPDREKDREQTFRYLREVATPGFIRMYWGLATEQMGWSLFDIAAGIGQPTLLIWGDRDHGMDMGEGVKRLRTLIPESELLIIEGAGHGLSAERPEEVARALIRFFLPSSVE